ncbi:MAG: dihydropteroate synthase [Actinomycetota bacterium]|nr:dihydropteroate synthase [Actinomycetota bacterium]
MLVMTGARVWRCGTHELVLDVRTLLMGIVNVTPDSFSDGGMFGDDPDAAIRHGVTLAAAGADILDVGGESTRPGADPVPEAIELERVVPVVAGLVKEVDLPVSVDTRKPEVARAALDAGASIVNDISAAAAPGMFEVVRAANAGLVMMHMQGQPKTMQAAPTYTDVVAEVRGFLADRIGAAVGAGVPRGRICVDPGIGFGKSMEHNLALLRGISRLQELRVPVMVGVSRKRFIGVLSGAEEPADRVEGTAGAVAWCATQGVDLVRVHDVLEMARVLRVVDALSRVESQEPA